MLKKDPISSPFLSLFLSLSLSLSSFLLLYYASIVGLLYEIRFDQADAPGPEWPVSRPSRRTDFD